MTDKSKKKEETRGQDGDKTAGFDKLKENWPSPFVSRDRISEFTGGLLKQTSMNTMDARGTGIQKRYRIGNRVFYEVNSVIDWLKAKAK
jgi:hypothetical protein